MQRARPSPAGAPGGRAGGRRGAGARRAELGRLLPRARAPSASPPARCACALAPPAPRPRSSGDRAATAELGAAGLGARGTRARPGPHPNSASQAPRRRRSRVNLGRPPTPLPASVSPLVGSATHCAVSWGVRNAEILRFSPLGGLTLYAPPIKAGPSILEERKVGPTLDCGSIARALRGEAMPKDPEEGRKVAARGISPQAICTRDPPHGGLWASPALVPTPPAFELAGSCRGYRALLVGEGWSRGIPQTILQNNNNSDGNNRAASYKHHYSQTGPAGCPHSSTEAPLSLYGSTCFFSPRPRGPKQHANFSCLRSFIGTRFRHEAAAVAGSESQLKKMVSKFKYRDPTVRKTVSVITLYKDLKPVLDSYVFNDGSSRELMNLTGAIPVPYRGIHINNPICLWLLDTYPYNPPICFVKPTSSMTIKTGKHVDANGKIYLPYLHEWKHSQSDSLGLIQVMTVVFGEELPVFSRPTISASYPPYQATGPPNTSYVPGMPSGISAYPSGYPPNPSGYPGCPYPPGGQYPVTTSSQYPSQPPVTTVGPSRVGTISEDTLSASLISAVSDKLRWRMKEEMARAQAELNALKRAEEDLKKGHQKLEEMVTCLDQEVAEVDKNIELLRKKDEELSSTLEKMENESENNDIDEVIIPTAPLYKQILNLYAEENAIEDTIFYLGEALRRGVIDLDVFLKHVCLLSCKQFQLRALMQEARKTAGLSDLY
ncbi:LOW QUALITY PROTEIN: tumor susceptibility gene 101 protein-like [Balaenoptera musculus]|uniref:LOW QUALITY PROTEIN: tumor susceptibility gene 101 protein-like n=1 Tax=Balaenoptera musculus TaxID=9771 RepID=A0A8B8YH63_BALMU|nr:LOW QUALITY PROTEIN: tumor susceptibility gene 101 protein-like [Balaenoptera musculus]